MKNQLISFLLGGFVFISFAAATTNIITVKPAVPKATIVVRGWATYELNTKIYPYLKQGYIVKNLDAGYGIIILEKY